LEVLLDCRKYRNPTSLPPRPTRPQLRRDHSASGLASYNVAFAEWVTLKGEWEQAARESRVLSAKLEAQFKVDLFDEQGWTHRAGRDLVFAMAWERGHSSGFQEVRSEFMELAELCARVVVAQGPGLVR
jgi:hypothetical protein